MNALDAAVDNLTELCAMIERRPDDLYIAAMKQYIVNPLEYLRAELIATPQCGKCKLHLGKVVTMVRAKK
jgi:hypothetical protein